MFLKQSLEINIDWKKFELIRYTQKTIVPQHTISESEFFYAVFKHKKKVNLFPDEKNIILKENVYDHIEQKCQC